MSQELTKESYLVTEWDKKFHVWMEARGERDEAP